MEAIQFFLDLFLHLDKHLGEIINQYGYLTYFILFLIIFCETGLVVTPFLPGDSLLFAVGSFAALGMLDLAGVSGLLFIAAVIGDAVNYSLGRHFGIKAFKPNARFLKTAHLEETRKFYERYGSKTIVIARFVPIVRTFAPFVAGVGSMPYRIFATYNVIGAAVWVITCVGAGYIFGNIPWVKERFSLVVLGIIAVSLLPVVHGYWQARKNKRVNE